MSRLNPVSSKVYNREYFLKHCGGGLEFQRSKGKELYDPHKHAIQLADLKPDDRVLDLGCGRGEVALNVARLTKSVLAIDYSHDAIDLALKAKKEFDLEVQRKVTFVRADFDTFPFPSNYFDVTLCLDVIEHLTQEQIDHIMAIIYRSLKPGGKVIIHTWPNRWHRETTYPISYYVSRITRPNRPKNPRREHEELMHISEQSPYELRCQLKKTGFKAKVFLRHYGPIGNSVYQWFYYIIHAVPPMKWFYCDHIWGIGIK